MRHIFQKSILTMLSALGVMAIVGATAGSIAAQDAPATTVVLVASPTYGTLITDSAGWSLYTWSGDVPGISNCYADCATTWPPFSASQPIAAPDGLPGVLATTGRLDGTSQITLAGWPLYYYSGDKAPGDTSGAGSGDASSHWTISSFGAPNPPVATDQSSFSSILAGGSTAPSTLGQSPYVPSPYGQPYGAAMWPYGAPPYGAPASGTPQQQPYGPPQNGAQTQPYAYVPQGPQPGQLPPVVSAPASADASASEAVQAQPSPTPYRQAQNDAFYVGPPILGPSGGPTYQAPLDTGFGVPSPAIATLPGGLQSVTVTAPPGGSIILSWTARAYLHSYRIYQATVEQPYNYSVIQTVQQPTGSLATTTTVSQLTPGKTYIFEVRGVDAQGLETVAPATAIITPVYTTGQLPAPFGLTSTTATGGTVTLSWGPSAGAASYRVLQASSASGPFTQALGGLVNGTSTTVSGLSANTTYYFQVVALDSRGTPSLPSSISIAPTTGSVGTPTNVAVAAVSQRTVTLTLTSAPGTTNFYVLTAANVAGPYAMASASMISTSSIQVGGLWPATPYYFLVIATDADGNESLPSNPVAATTLPGNLGQ